MCLRRTYYDLEICFDTITPFIKSISKSLVILVIRLALSGAIYSRIAPFFALSRIFFSANENGSVKQNNQSDSKVRFKWSIKFQESERQKVLQLLLPKLCYCFSPKIVRFQYGSNKVAIELRVVQFWSEIMLVISNRTRAMRSFDLEIKRMISDLIIYKQQFLWSDTSIKSFTLPVFGQCIMG